MNYIKVNKRDNDIEHVDYNTCIDNPEKEREIFMGRFEGVTYFE